MKRLRPFVPYLILAIIAASAAYFLYPVAGLEGGVAPALSASDAEDLSAKIMDELLIDRSQMRAKVEFRPDDALLRQVYESFDQERGNTLIRTLLPGYTWRVRWSKRTRTDFSFGGSDDKDAAEKALAWLAGDVEFSFDQNGRLKSYNRSIPDSVAVTNLTRDSALAVARPFFDRHLQLISALTGVSPASLFADSSLSIRRSERPRRVDQTQEWRLRDTTLRNEVVVSYTVSGSLLTGAGVRIEYPDAFKSYTARTIHSVYNGVLYFVTLTLLVIVTFKRFRAYEIGFRLATFVGVATGLILGIRLYISLSSEMGVEIIFPLVFGPLFFGGGLILVWAAAETAIRETFREKMITFDLLVNGHIFHSRIGAAILRGTALGVASVAVVPVVVFVVTTLTGNGVSFEGEDRFDFLSSSIPILASPLESLYAHVYKVTFFLMFLAPRIVRRTSSLRTAALVVVVVLSSLQMLLYDPSWAGFVIGIASSSMVVFAFFRHDILTAFITPAAATSFLHALYLMSGEGEVHMWSAAGIVCVLGCALVWGALSQFRRSELQDLDAITPAFAKHITERERLKHELSIAQQVQMSFLPKENPVIPSLDIASRCAPAMEVGGDYYDFLPLGKDRLGIVVGDVSGKGTQAAFFMTLTKGFLKALAQVSDSPGAILKSVNRLFYENVERGVFISLVCGVFDTSRGSLTIARAGHNPVILRKSQTKGTQVLMPTGLALGLDEGALFGRSIEEVAISYEPGDVFVFYTDGVSEAMNLTREEYGETRLSTAVEANASKHAAGILEGILSEVGQFVGKAQQHDDITMVVVKIVSV